MGLSVLSSSRTVLQVSDEALYVYVTSARGVRLVEAVPWDVDNFEQNIVALIRKDCSGAPVLILNDMVDQQYRKERVIRAGVGALDRANMLKRKLNFAFPNYSIKAAYSLSEKLENRSKKKAADVYIFAAIPESHQISQVLGATFKSLALVSGLCLLPVESSDMVKTLSAKLTKKKSKKAKWTLFIGQHHNGGLRQIVIKDGDLALTRMTPIVDNDNDIDLWVSDVHQELKATMSYLSRFGYQPEDGIDLIIISNSSAHDALQKTVGEQYNLHTLTTADAAGHLGLNIGVQDDFRYADPLHVAWVARKKRFILSMKSSRLDRVSNPQKISKIASVLLFFSAAFIAYLVSSESSSIYTLSSKYEIVEKDHAQLDSQFQREVQRKKELGFDVQLIQSSLAVYEKMEERRIKPLSLFKGIGYALGKDLRLDRVSIELANDSIVPKAFTSVFSRSKAVDPVPLFTTKMQMTYPASTDVAVGNEEVLALQKRLQGFLPDHEVLVTKFIKDYEYIEEIVVETGDLKKQDVTQDFVIEIIVKGPLVDG